MKIRDMQALTNQMKKDQALTPILHQERKEHEIRNIALPSITDI